jgi:6-phosphogluconolactonase
VSLPIQPDGSLAYHTFFSQHTGSSIRLDRQGEPHAHSINLSQDNQFAYVADLGTDKIHAYIFDPVEGLMVAKPEFNTHMQPGSGPRHLDFSPDEKYAYVINELNCTITTLKRVSKTRLY